MRIFHTAYISKVQKLIVEGIEMVSILRKSLAVLVLVLAMSLATTTTLAQGGGIIVITPQWPIEVGTPATLEISVVPAADPTYYPSILLVMTEDCWNGLTSVSVTWTGGSVSFIDTDFTELEDGPGVEKIPDATISDVQYTRAALADHLYEPGTATVYYAMFDLTGVTLHTTPETLTVTLDSTDPKMLVYALGRSVDDPTAKFDRWVPPTNPGFVVPELGTILLALASFSALALYTLQRRKHFP